MNSPGTIIAGRAYRQIDNSTWGKAFESIMIVVTGQPDLPQIIGTLRTTCSLTGHLNRRQKQSDQDSDNGYNDQKFNECESRSIQFLHSHLSIGLCSVPINTLVQSFRILLVPTLMKSKIGAKCGSSANTAFLSPQSAFDHLLPWQKNLQLFENSTPTPHGRRP